MLQCGSEITSCPLSDFPCSGPVRSRTETGCIGITNFPGMEIKARLDGSMGKPFPGIIATVLDPRTYEPLNRVGAGGLIALRPGWPSQIRGYWNNAVGYHSKFKIRRAIEVRVSSESYVGSIASQTRYQFSRVSGKPLSPCCGLASRVWYTFKRPVRNR